MKSCGLAFVSWKAVCTAGSRAWGWPGQESVRAPGLGASSGTAAGEWGHGRSSLEGLEAREEVVDLPEGQQKCPRCVASVSGDRRGPGGGARDPSLAPGDGRFPAVRGPGIVTAPSPARLIPRGKLKLGQVSLFASQSPTLQELADQGVRISPGTIAGGLRQLLPLLEPVGGHPQQTTERGSLAGRRDRLASVRGGGGRWGRAGIWGVSIPFDGAVHPVYAVRPWCRRRTSERRWPAFC